MKSGQREITVWGTGEASREFLYAEDCAQAIHDAVKAGNIGPEPMNIGTGEEVSIKELAEEIKEVCNFKGKLKFNSNLPDGNPRKLLDSTKMNNLGWSHKISLKDGLKSTYEWYIKNI